MLLFLFLLLGDLPDVRVVLGSIDGSCGVTLVVVIAYRSRHMRSDSWPIDWKIYSIVTNSLFGEMCEITMWRRM